MLATKYKPVRKHTMRVCMCLCMRDRIIYILCIYIHACMYTSVELSTGIPIIGYGFSEALHLLIENLRGLEHA